MEYWIIVDNRHAGPYTATQLVAAGLRPDTLVWHEGMTDWIPAGEVTELAAMIAVRDNTPDVCAPVPGDEPAVAPSHAGEVSSEPAPSAPVAAPESPAAPSGYTPVGDPASAHRWQQPQAPAPAPVMSEPCPPAYVAWSVIATVICCIPLGIPAIVYSSMVKSAYYKGDIAKARRYSNLAQWFIILAITLGAVSWPFQLALTL